MTDDGNPEATFDPTDPLAAAWARQDATTSPSLLDDPAKLVRSVSKAHRKDQLKLLWLNIQEVVPIVVIAGYFAAQIGEAERPIALFASIAVVVGVGGFLLVGSIRHHRSDRQWDRSTRGQLAQRLAQVEHRVRLYRGVLWWYILPLTGAALLLRYGLGGDQAPLGPYLLFFAAIGGVLYVLNRWYSRKHFEPEVERFRALLADFDRASQS